MLVFSGCYKGMAHRVEALCLCLPVAIRWHDDSSAILIGLINRVGCLEPIGRFRMTSIEEMNSLRLREAIAALFHRKFYHGESTTCDGGAVPKES